MSTQKTFRVARYVAACAVTALSFGATAYAGDAATEVGPKVTVRYGDLDLSRDADVRALYARLSDGSDQVCRDYKEARELRIKRQYDACYQDALARAVDSVGHAAVKAVYASDERVRVASRSTRTQVRS